MKEKKERFLAILFALIVGCYGIVWFYLQDNNKAIKYLVTTIIGVLTSFLFIGLIPLVIVAILALIDALKFAFMSDEEFNKLFNTIVEP